MGICVSSTLTKEEKEEIALQTKLDNKFNKVIETREAAEKKIRKVLLLGAGESGKSTLFKQMVKLYGNGYSKEDLAVYTKAIERNISSSMRTLVFQSKRFAKIDASFALDEETLEIWENIASKLNEDIIITPEMAVDILKVWNSPQIQKTYEERSKFQLSDGSKYLIEKVCSFADPEYIPTEDDILYARVRTTGIVEQNFTVDKSGMKVFDLGGQRNERRKWIQCFDNVDSIIFVAAISEYDQVLYEDQQTNRMEETMNLFSEICNAEHFLETSMILFLNKKDLFEAKYLKIPPSCYFEDYNAEFSADPIEQLQYGFDFISLKFQELNENAEDGKDIFVHVTNATDNQNMAFVLKAVKTMLLQNSMENSGFSV